MVILNREVNITTADQMHAAITWLRRTGLRR